jgi:hypothetical protein
VALGPPGAENGTGITSVAVDASRAVVAGVFDGRPRMWSAPLRHGVPGAWSQLDAPPSAPAPVRKVEVSISPLGLIAALIGSTSSTVWTSAAIG